MISERLRGLIRDFKWDVSGIAMWIPGYGAKLSTRALYTEVGLSGHVSDLDAHFAEEQGLRPLNGFERWLLGPRIEVQKATNWQRFRQAMIEVTGEDPDNPYDDYVEDPEYDDYVSGMFSRQIADNLKDSRWSFLPPDYCSNPVG